MVRKSRVCAYKGCNTILNSYNSNKCCHEHQMLYVQKLESKVYELENLISHKRYLIREAPKVEKHRESIVRLKKRIALLKKRVANA